MLAPLGLLISQLNLFLVAKARLACGFFSLHLGEGENQLLKKQRMTSII